MPSDLERATARFRRALLAQDNQSRAAVQRSYRAAIASLRNELRAAMASVAAIRAEGGEVPTWRLLQEQRVRQLLARAEIEFARHAATVQQQTIQAQQDAIRKAQDESVRLIEAGFGPPPAGAVLPIHTLPLGAIQELTAAVQPNAPVRRLLQEFAGDAVEAVQDELVGGVAAGNSPSQITRAITNRLGREQRVRAERIVRTESMRAFREATRATMVANKHLVEKWIWYSGLGTRTCAVCWALHGKEFDVDTKMATHPNCRCVLMPKTKSWKDLGYDVPDTRPAVPTGPELFAKLSADEQHAILGPGAYAAYRAGDVALPDFVGVTRSTVWGTGRRRRSLTTILGADRVRELRSVASAPSDPVVQLQARGVTSFNGTPTYKFGTDIQTGSKFEVEPDVFKQATGYMVDALQQIERRFGISADTKLRARNRITDKINDVVAQNEFVAFGDYDRALHAGNVGERILYNTKHWTNGKENNLGFFRSSAADAERQGKPKDTPYFASKSEEHVLIHEFGHSIHNAAKVMAPKAYDDYVAAWNTMKESDYWVSQYAVTNTSEGFSEAFAAMVTGVRIVPPQMAQSIETIIETIKAENTRRQRKQAA